MFFPCFVFVPGLIIGVLVLRYFISKKKKRLHTKAGNDKLVHVGFFHPYCNAGGGGERVLWCAIRGLLRKLVN